MKTDTKKRLTIVIKNVPAHQRVWRDLANQLTKVIQPQITDNYSVIGRPLVENHDMVNALISVETEYEKCEHIRQKVEDFCHTQDLDCDQSQIVDYIQNRDADKFDSEYEFDDLKEGEDQVYCNSPCLT
jgi:hypothetical protein